MVYGIQETTAGVAQLAEHNVANVVVVGSNPITRSSYCGAPQARIDFLSILQCGGRTLNPGVVEFTELNSQFSNSNRK